MILEYLQPDASLLDGITVIIRALYYIATIGAAGRTEVLDSRA